jgi:hypothetical protein
MRVRRRKVKGEKLGLVSAGYFDILGFSSLVDLSQDDWFAAIGKIKALDDELTKHLADLDLTEHGIVRVFSDNVYFASPFRWNGRVYADNLLVSLRYVSQMHWFLVNRGIFFRGGLALGSQYVTSNALFGSALVKAYSAQVRAKVPRVIVDESFDNGLKKVSARMSGNRAESAHLLIRKDEDGLNFVDYLLIWSDAHWTEQIREYVFRRHKREIMRQVRATADKEILRKYVWLSRYHNLYASRYGQAIDIRKQFSDKLPDADATPMEGDRWRDGRNLFSTED